MKTALVASVACLWMVASATAQPASKGLAPVLRVVSNVDQEKGDIVFVVTETKIKQELIEREVIVKGMKMRVTETVFVPYYVQVQQVVKAVNSRVITSDGKQLPIEQVWKRIKANTVIAVSSDGNTPNQAFLRALSAETLILIAPPPAPQAPPVPKKENP